MEQPLRAVVAERLVERLTAACRSRLPYETCGILTGEAGEGVVEARDFALVRNAADDPRKAFAFDPDDWVRAAYDAQKNRQRIVGFFHSHPSGSTAPSAADARGWIGWMTYWIVGFGPSGEAAVSAYFRGEDGHWRTLPWRAEPRR